MITDFHKFFLILFLSIELLSSNNKTNKPITVFQNHYLFKNQLVSEDLIIPFSVFEERNQKIVLKNKTHYFVKTNTLLKIHINDLIPEGQLLHQNKSYMNEFTILVKDKPLTLPIVKERKKQYLYINIDETPPLIKLIFPNFFLKKNKSYITQKGEVRFLLEDLGVGNVVTSINLNGKPLIENSLKKIFNFDLKEIENKINIKTQDQFKNQIQKKFFIKIDRLPPQVFLIINDFKKSWANYSQDTFPFHKKISLYFKVKDDNDPTSRVFYNANIAQNEFTLLAEKMIIVNKTTTIYFYAQDKFNNTSPIQKIKLIKNQKENIIAL